MSTGRGTRSTTPDARPARTYPDLGEAYNNIAARYSNVRPLNVVKRSATPYPRQMTPPASPEVSTPAEASASVVVSAASGKTTPPASPVPESPAPKTGDSHPFIHADELDRTQEHEPTYDPTDDADQWYGAIGYNVNKESDTETGLDETSDKCFPVGPRAPPVSPEGSLPDTPALGASASLPAFLKSLDGHGSRKEAVFHDGTGEEDNADQSYVRKSTNPYRNSASRNPYTGQRRQIVSASDELQHARRAFDDARVAEQSSQAGPSQRSLPSNVRSSIDTTISGDDTTYTSSIYEEDPYQPGPSHLLHRRDQQRFRNFSTPRDAYLHQERPVAEPDDGFVPASADSLADLSPETAVSEAHKFQQQEAPEQETRRERADKFVQDTARGKTKTPVPAIWHQDSVRRPRSSGKGKGKERAIEEPSKHLSVVTQDDDWETIGKASSCNVSRTQSTRLPEHVPDVRPPPKMPSTLAANMPPYLDPGLQPRSVESPFAESNRASHWSDESDLESLSHWDLNDARPPIMHGSSPVPRSPAPRGSRLPRSPGGPLPAPSKSMRSLMDSLFRSATRPPPPVPKPTATTAEPAPTAPIGQGANDIPLTPVPPLTFTERRQSTHQHGRVTTPIWAEFMGMPTVGESRENLIRSPRVLHTHIQSQRRPIEPALLPIANDWLQEPSLRRNGKRFTIAAACVCALFPPFLFIHGLGGFDWYYVHFTNNRFAVPGSKNKWISVRVAVLEVLLVTIAAVLAATIGPVIARHAQD